MAKEDKDQTKEPEGGNAGGQGDGTENETANTKETPMDQAAVDALLEKPEVKAVLNELLQRNGDKRATQAAATAKKSALEDAKKQQREDKLLEDQDYKALLAEREKETAEAKAQLEAYERKDRISSLLDKELVTDPEQRNGFHMLVGDLETVKVQIDAQKAMIERLANEKVNKLLKTDAPPSGKATDQTLTADDVRGWSTEKRVEYIRKEGKDAYEAVIARRGKK